MQQKSVVDVFNEQIRCILADDRESQLALLDENCVYEFPFALDRPRVIEGQARVREVLLPIWLAARQSGKRYVDSNATFYRTEDPEFLIVELQLTRDVHGEVGTASFVQLLRVKNGKVVHLREYATPALPGAKSPPLES